MKLALGRLDLAPATIRGDKDRMIKRTQKAAGMNEVRRERCGWGVRNASKSQNRVKGIALANAKPTRPRDIVCWRLVADRAKDMLKIQPAMANAERPNRRLTEARGL